jgi:alkane 1-monooxygenase
MKNHRFALAWLLPLLVGAAAWHSPWSAWVALLAFQLALAAAERWPGAQRSPPAAPRSSSHRRVLWVHCLLQAALLALGVWVTMRHGGHWLAIVALGIGVGGVTGGQGITMAHELGHSRSRAERAMAWVLMGSVCYCHFMVEHYRGHHVRAATEDDPASARWGENLWRFLPRTLRGSFVSAWRLEGLRLQRKKATWIASPLAWASVLQLVFLWGLFSFAGGLAVVFWLVQAGYAVFLLETTNFIEHYGLRRERGQPFGVQHAWNADHLLTNCFLVNLQRHSDHHMHAWKPYPELEALPGPQLPTGYAGCLFLTLLPPVWSRLMDRRALAWQPQGPDTRRDSSATR